MKTTTFRKLFASAFLAGALSTSALANTITNSNTTGTLNTDGTFSFNVAQAVIPGGYHVTGVTLDINVQAPATDFSLTNTSGSTQTFGLGVQTAVDVTGNSASSDGLGNLVPAGWNSGGSSPFFTQNITLGPTGSGTCANNTPNGSCSFVTYLGVTSSADTGIINIGAGSWANYVGGGSVTINGHTNTVVQWNGGSPNITLADTYDVTATIVVTDAPNGVPEPATMALMGSALLGFAALLRRKRVRQ